jgi:hypothetical protein
MKKTFACLISLMIVICIMPASQAETNWEVKIKYSGEWSGSAGGTTSASYEGVGSETLTISGDIVSAVIQKQEDNSDELCVELWTGGELKESSCTTAGYGLVSVSGDNFEKVPGFGIMMAVSAIGLALATIRKNDKYIS